MTIGEGKLTAWEAPSGAAAFEVAGGYRLPVATVRGRAWLAIAAGDHIDLIETETSKCLARLPLTGAKLTDTLADLAVSPDGRLWGFGPDPTRKDEERREWSSRPGQPWNPAADPRVALLPVELVAMDSGPAGPQDIFTPQTPLAVEVDLRKAERGEQPGRQQLELLQKKGYTIGPSKWRLVADAEAFDSGNTFTNRLPIPALRLRWKFLTPEGTETWKHEKMFFFEEVEEKFEVGERRTRTKGPLVEDVIEERYEFGGSPREVIIDALLDRAASYVTVEAFPRQTGKFNGKYQELPAQGEVKFGTLEE